MQAMIRVLQATLRPIVVCAPVLVLLLSLSLVLSGSKQDCSQPVRLWLTGNIWIYLLLLVSELLFAINYHNSRRHGELGQRCAKIRSVVLRALLGLWLSWFAVGNWWVYSDQECPAQWPTGYLSAVALLCMYYIALVAVAIWLCRHWRQNAALPEDYYFVLESQGGRQAGSCRRPGLYY